MALRSHCAIRCLAFIALGWWLGGCGDTASLNEALDGLRPLEGRLVGGFPHAPCERTTTPFGSRSTCPALSPDTLREILELPSVASVEPASVTRGQAPQRSIEPTRLVLAAEETSDLAHPIDLLRERLATDPNDALARSDLTVALLRRETLGGSPIDLLDAAEHAAQAIAIAPELSEAHFNHAVALERLFLRSAAAKAWSDFLDIETDPEWRTEARERLVDLEAPLPTAEPRRLTLSPVDDPVGAAGELLRLLEAAGTVDGQAHAMREIERMASTLEGPVAEGYRALAEAAESGDDQSVRRISPLNRAIGAFGPMHPMGLASRYRLLRCHYLARDSKRVARDGARLLTDARESRADAVAARVAWALGTVALNQGHLASASEHYEDAAEHFRAADDASQVPGLRSVQALVLEQRGNSTAAWPIRIAALNDSIRSAHRPRLSLIFNEAAHVLAEKGRARMALAYQDEAVALDLASGSALAAAEALADLARFALADADAERATDALVEAQAWVQQIDDPDLARQTAANLSVLEGEWAALYDPSHAIEGLDNVRAHFAASDQDYVLFDVERLRADALLALGQVDEAVDALALSSAHLEKRLDGIGDPFERIQLRDRGARLVDATVRAEWTGRRDAHAAWNAHEQARARSLRASRGAPVADLAKVQAALPPDTLIIDSRVLDDRLLLWCLGRDRFDLVDVAVSRTELVRTVDAMVRGIRDDEPGVWRALARRLHDWLIEPAGVPDDADLVVLADPLLQRVPFAALIEPSSGDFLVSRHAITTSPSASVFAHLVDRPSLEPSGPPTAVVVGDPAFDEDVHGIPRLQYAPAEARWVAERYPGSVLLIGEAATRSALFDALPRHRRLHIAAHALPRPATPLDARLLLAPEAGHSGDLTVRELFEAPLDGLDFVFLSACESGRGYDSALEGTLSLAHPFLAAGTPRVVSTLWTINDAMSRPLVEAFYRALDLDPEPARALQSAQLAMIASDQPADQKPSTWAAFQVVGVTHPRAES